MLSFFFQAEDGIRDRNVTGVQTCALPICNIAVYGDEDYNAAERTAEAELRFAWSKGGYEPQDVLFTADGATIRVPEVEEVQKFVDAAAKGDDDTAGAMATDEVMRDLDTVIGD